MGLTMSIPIQILDTTARDGEQSPGICLSKDQKTILAKKLEKMGVNIIEAGFAANGASEFECIQSVAKHCQTASVCSLARCLTSDIDKAAEALAYAKQPRIHCFSPTSDIQRQYLGETDNHVQLEQIRKSILHAKKHFDIIQWSAMDATRSDCEFLCSAIEVAINSGASVINLPDTVGIATPETYQALFTTMVKKFPKAIFSAHAHNDLGLATANTLAALNGGARQIEVTINGIGERAGNAALEETVVAIKTRPDVYPFETTIHTQAIGPISEFVSKATGLLIQKNKAIVGDHAFKHESGIHQDGILKNKATFEVLDPESLGVKSSKLIIGKHSGKSGIQHKLKQLNQILSPKQLKLLKLLINEHLNTHSALTDQNLMNFIQKIKSSYHE